MAEMVLRVQMAAAAGVAQDAIQITQQLITVVTVAQVRTLQ
jgi:hypothetical protein